MQWSHPETTGEGPPPCRAHSATQVDRRIFVFGGGAGLSFFNDLYVLDTVLRSWTKVVHPPNAKVPIPRRAHTTWLYKGKIYMFGGGNGEKALNDVWTLDVTVPYEEMRWEEVKVEGDKPGPRGYHTANLVRDVVVIIGGSDGSYMFDDVWVLNLNYMRWQQIKLETNKRRLGHTSTQVGSYLFVIGGHDGTQYSRDLQLFNLVTFQWEPRETKGRQPQGRGYHRAVLHDSRVFVFGGFDGMRVFEDVHVLDLAAAAYLPQVTSFMLMQEAEILR
ncbi:hypothetical protein M422DRAFT_60410 [Sphaerobolus stellatus SS14]|nr:hypothetical protein M422DRAFT_60410 [Sphaerobolus stellatus SS14]